jgi:glycosyltransferase involved in cell wall biosynthesis
MDVESSQVAGRAKKQRVAIVHDWLTVIGGAERTLVQILKCFPDADVFTVVDFLSDEERAIFGKTKITTSFLQKFPFARKRYRTYLPLMPMAVEALDLREYDVIISNSHAVAKGVMISPDQLHIAYTLSPIRYAWDMQHQYLKDAKLGRGIKGALARTLLRRVREWDLLACSRVDEFVSISSFVAQRVWRCYRRKSQVLFPPVDTDFFVEGGEKENYYVAASRLVPFKRMDAIVAAFRLLPQERLVVIGAGPDYERLCSLAGSNVTMMGYQTDEVLRQKLQGAKAFIFASEEDFGIAPIEAQACGTPVIAFGKGGALETIRGIESEKPTGLFFPQQTPESIAEAVSQFQKYETLFTRENCQENALRFGNARFKAEFAAMVGRAVRYWEDGTGRQLRNGDLQSDSRSFE